MITKSVQQMLKDGELKPGTALKFRWVDHWVTFDSIVEINYHGDITIKDKEGGDYWAAVSFEDVIINNNDKYHFFDTDINFNKLCIDALEDKKVGFIVIGSDKAYVGLLQSGKSIGIPAAYEDFITSDTSTLNFIPDLPYGVFEIPKTKINSWKKKLEKYSEDYHKWKDSLDTMIKDRNREKERNNFTVLQF